MVVLPCFKPKHHVEAWVKAAPRPALPGLLCFSAKRLKHKKRVISRSSVSRLVIPAKAGIQSHIRETTDALVCLRIKANQKKPNN